jgi:hypothetical protein
MMLVPRVVLNGEFDTGRSESEFHRQLARDPSTYADFAETHYSTIGTCGSAQEAMCVARSVAHHYRSAKHGVLMVLAVLCWHEQQEPRPRFQ